MSTIDIPCQPTGDLRPWPDDRPRRCTLCAEPVSLRSLPDGSDWLAVDATGSPMGREPLPDLCACYPPGDGFRTRGGRIHSQRHPGDEVDEKPRHYGAGLPAAAWFGLHTHDASGGEWLYSSLSPLPMACGHRLPAVVRAVPIEPYGAEPPRCHGRPMRWAPRGWSCRPTGSFTPSA